MKKGKGGNTKKEKKPTKFDSEFERLIWEKPAFKALYDRMMKQRMQNQINLLVEYVNNPKNAVERYKGTEHWDRITAEIEEALNAKVEQVVTSGKIDFAGFPSAMGEPGLRVELERFGALKSVTCEPSDDGMTLAGSCEFEEVAAAKAAIDKWHGVDMGMGAELELLAA